MTLSSCPTWLLLRKITLLTSQGTYELAGIPEAAVQAMEAAIQEARWRKVAFDALSSQATQVQEALASPDALAARDAYLTFSEMANWRASLSPLDCLNTLSAADADLLTRLSQEQQRDLRRMRVLTTDPQKAIDQRNATYVQYQLKSYSEFFDGVESNPLTDQQREAIVHDEDNALVIAGAGTGKTSTVVGKVGYILKKGWATPEEILLLAFTKKAADEMQERIEKKLGVQVKVRTFHALGLEIVAKAQGRKPSLCSEAEDPRIKAQTIKSLITNQLADDPVLAMVLADGEAFEHSEERRLFYVGLTRARKRVYLLADAASPSAFVREVLAEEGYEKVIKDEGSSATDVCPSCVRGKVMKREGDFGIFFSCSNQPICGYKEQPCSWCKRGRMRQSGEKEVTCGGCGLKGRTCPQCQVGVLIIKHGKNSGRAFWGCSTFGQNSDSCDYKEWLRS